MKSSLRFMLCAATALLASATWAQSETNLTFVDATAVPLDNQEREVHMVATTQEQKGDLTMKITLKNETGAQQSNVPITISPLFASDFVSSFAITATASGVIQNGETKEFTVTFPDVPFQTMPTSADINLRVYGEYRGQYRLVEGIGQHTFDLGRAGSAPKAPMCRYYMPAFYLTDDVTPTRDVKTNNYGRFFFPAATDGQPKQLTLTFQSHAGAFTIAGVENLPNGVSVVSELPLIVPGPGTANLVLSYDPAAAPGFQSKVAKVIFGVKEGDVLFDAATATEYKGVVGPTETYVVLTAVSPKEGVWYDEMEVADINESGWFHRNTNAVYAHQEDALRPASMKRAAHFLNTNNYGSNTKRDTIFSPKVRFNPGDTLWYTARPFGTAYTGTFTETNQYYGQSGRHMSYDRVTLVPQAGYSTPMVQPTAYLLTPDAAGVKTVTSNLTSQNAASINLYSGEFNTYYTVFPDGFEGYLVFTPCNMVFDSFYGGKLVPVTYNLLPTAPLNAVAGSVNDPVNITVSARNVSEQIAKEAYVLRVYENNVLVKEVAGDANWATDAEKAFATSYVAHTAGAVDLRVEIAFPKLREQTILGTTTVNVTAEAVDPVVIIGDPTSTGQVNYAPLAVANSRRASESMVLYTPETLASYGLQPGDKIRGVHYYIKSTSAGEAIPVDSLYIWLKQMPKDITDPQTSYSSNKHYLDSFFTAQARNDTLFSTTNWRMEKPGGTTYTSYRFPFNKMVTWDGESPLTLATYHQWAISSTSGNYNVAMPKSDSKYNIWYLYQNSTAYDMVSLSTSKSGSRNNSYLPVIALELDKTMAKLTGTVTGSNGRPLYNGTVTIVTADDIRYSAVTNAQGKYEMIVVRPEHSYTLVVDDPNHKEYRLEGLTFMANGNVVAETVKDVTLEAFGDAAAYTVTVTVNAQEGVNLAGKPLTVKHATKENAYENITLDDSHKAQFQAYGGVHSIELNVPGYTVAKVENLSVNKNVAVELLVDEIVAAPALVSEAFTRDAYTGESTLTLSWDAVPAATQYVVNLKNNDPASLIPALPAVTTAETTATFQSVQPGEYTGEVVAKFATGDAAPATVPVVIGADYSALTATVTVNNGQELPEGNLTLVGAETYELPLAATATMAALPYGEYTASVTDALWYQHFTQTLTVSEATTALDVALLETIFAPVNMTISDAPGTSGLNVTIAWTPDKAEMGYVKNYAVTLNDAPAGEPTENTFTFENLANGNYRVSVAAVYASGTSEPLQREFTVNQSGLVALDSDTALIAAAPGQVVFVSGTTAPAALYTVQGTLVKALTVNAGTTVVDAAPGVYVATLGSATAKVIVK